MRSGLELLCRSVVLFEEGMLGRDRRAEEISLLEHRLTKASDNLKQSLATNSALSAEIAREGAEREIAQEEVAEAKRLLGEEKAEKLRVVAENASLKKLVEESNQKLSSSAKDLAALQAAKDEVEAELDKNYEDSEELLKQCFDRAVHQALVLYGGSPTSGDFNIDYEVYQGRLEPSSEVAALIAQEIELAGTEEGEAEARGREAEAEEGECVEIQD